MKELKDYLHLYLGCKIQLRNSAFSEPIPDDENLFTLVAVSQNSFQVAETGIWYEIINGFRGYSPDKPILRPLIDITKDEVAELLNIDVSATIIQGNFCSPFFQVEYVDNYKETTFEHRYLTQLSPDQVVYLLSKHFDLFGLIEAGLAIDQTTLQIKTKP